MTNKTKFKICDWSLLFLTVVILASGMQLEINPTGASVWVWAHIVLGIMFIVGIFWHINLHKSGYKKRKPNSGDIWHKHTLMVIFFLLTLLSGVIATFHWIGSYHHSTLGGVHGKFGFLFIIAVILHIARNKRFYCL